MNNFQEPPRDVFQKVDPKPQGVSDFPDVYPDPPIFPKQNEISTFGAACAPNIPRFRPVAPTQTSTHQRTTPSPLASVGSPASYRGVVGCSTSTSESFQSLIRAPANVHLAQTMSENTETIPTPAPSG